MSSKPAKRLYGFGPFIVDAGEGLLLRDGQAISLTPKAFETLIALVENSGHVLGKDELMLRVWPDSFVEENNLSQNISILRKTLGEGADGTNISRPSRNALPLYAGVTDLRTSARVRRGEEAPPRPRRERAGCGGVRGREGPSLESPRTTSARRAARANPAAICCHTRRRQNTRVAATSTSPTR